MLFDVAWPLLAFEIIDYLLFALCLMHALRQGERSRERVALLLTGTVFGVLLETLTIYQLHAYYYGHFLIMFHGEVPLAIGVGWGIILYSAVAFADALRLTGAAWAATVGLLGLNIDLTMDAVAIRLGMWNWRAYHLVDGQRVLGLYDPGQAWFGVPYGNFYAWFIVLTSAAAFWRWLAPDASKSVVALAGRCLLVLLGSLIALALLDAVYVRYAVNAWWPVAVEILGAASLIALSVRSQQAQPRDPAAVQGAPALAVPLAFHLYFAGMLVMLAVAPTLAPRADIRATLPGQFPALLSISGVMLIAGLAAHIWHRQHAAVPVAAPTPTPVTAE